MTKSVNIHIKNSNSLNEHSRKRTRGTIHSCARCNGTGKIYENPLRGPTTCPVCKGKGKNRI
jgi:DnaJ-class molecular chaperone